MFCLFMAFCCRKSGQKAEEIVSMSSVFLFEKISNRDIGIERGNTSVSGMNTGKKEYRREFIRDYKLISFIWR